MVAFLHTSALCLLTPASYCERSRINSLNSQQFNYSTILSAQTTGIYYTNGKKLLPIDSVNCRSLFTRSIDDRSHLKNIVASIELTFHFLPRRICDKIPSYVNLSICFTVLLHERENYIALPQWTVGLCLRDRRSIAFVK